MIQVLLNDTVIAESTSTPTIVEGNYYFAPDTLHKQYFNDSNTQTTCSWKGVASYYNVQVGDTNVTDAAWYYPTPKSAAENIKGHVAFYKNKVVIKEKEE